MATIKPIEPIELGSYIVEGEYTCFVLLSLEWWYREEHGARYRVVDEEDNDIYTPSGTNTFSDKDAALDFAERYADTGPWRDSDEIGDGMTDAEADADVLASAGMGTDEDYGYFGGDE